MDNSINLDVGSQTVLQQRWNASCFITKPTEYDYLIIQPSFIYTEQNTLTTSNYNSIGRDYTRVFITYNNVTRYCQQEYTYSICNINNLPNDEQARITIILGVDIPIFNRIIGKATLSPIINYGKLYNSQQQEIINQNTQIINNQNEIKDTDIGDSTKEKLDDTEQKKAENNINNVNDILDQNKEEINFNINTDTKANSFIWNTLTRILQTNTLIFTMITSILLVGVIKLILGR